jgi:hypothetical protein
MQCSQCQTELPDSANACPQCGTANEQPHQPVMFSYLPVGTPPWPITVPQRPSYESAPAAAVPASLSKSQETKPRRSLRSILLAIAILVLVPILGVTFTLTSLYFNGELFPKHTTAPSKTITNQTQATPAATPATQQTPGTTQGNQLPAPASFSKTSDKDLNVSLQYPSDWQAGPPDKSSTTVAVGIYPSQKYVIFVVERFLGSALAQITDTNSLNQATVNEIGSQVGATGMQNVPISNAKPTIGGAKWDEMDVTFSDTNGSKEYLTTISVLHNKSYYNITFLTLDSLHDEAMQKYIQPMLNSVQFLS